MATIGRITEWHESHQKFHISNLNKQNEARIQSELVEANQELKIRRRQRLKELYQKELALFEQQLNDMGLAIYKDRP
jgi:hypothetical protein